MGKHKLYTQGEIKGIEMNDPFEKLLCLGCGFIFAKKPFLPPLKRQDCIRRLTERKKKKFGVWFLLIDHARNTMKKMFIKNRFRY